MSLKIRKTNIIFWGNTSADKSCIRDEIKRKTSLVLQFWRYHFASDLKLREFNFSGMGRYVFDVTSPKIWIISKTTVKTSNLPQISCVYWTVHYCDSWRIKDQLDVTVILFRFLCAEHVSDINISIIKSLRIFLLNYHICLIVLGSMCVGVSVWLGWSGIRVAGWTVCNTDTHNEPRTIRPMW